MNRSDCAKPVRQRPPCLFRHSSSQLDISARFFPVLSIGLPRNRESFGCTDGASDAGCVNRFEGRKTTYASPSLSSLHFKCSRRVLELIPLFLERALPSSSHVALNFAHCSKLILSVSTLRYLKSLKAAPTFNGSPLLTSSQKLHICAVCHRSPK